MNILPVNQHDIYFNSAYYSLHELTGFGKSFCMVFKREDSIIMKPFLLNKLDVKQAENSYYYEIRGAYGYNGIIKNTSNLKFIADFKEYFTEFCIRNNVVSSFFRFHPVLKNEIESQIINPDTKDRDVVVIDLSKDYDYIWSREFNCKTRNVIRKAFKSEHQVLVYENPSQEQIDRFIQIYRGRMQVLNAKKFYFFNEEYFNRTFIQLKGMAYLANVVNKDGEVLCSSIFYHSGDYFHYHLSARTAQADNSVNNFLIDRMINYAKNKGAKFLNLGGGRTAAPNDTLFLFKKSFAKELTPFHYEFRIYNHQVYELINSGFGHVVQVQRNVP